MRTSGTAISANHRNADVSSECVGGHKGACRYEFGDEKGRGRIRNGSSAGGGPGHCASATCFTRAKLHSPVATRGGSLSEKGDDTAKPAFRALQTCVTGTE